VPGAAAATPDTRTTFNYPTHQRGYAVIPTVLDLVQTSHDATSWNVHRSTLVQFAHEAGGHAYIGVTGQRADALIAQSYDAEAVNLAADLAALAPFLDPDRFRFLLGELNTAISAPAGGRRRRDTDAAAALDAERATGTGTV
jgi:hypothetical protein